MWRSSSSVSRYLTSCRACGTTPIARAILKGVMAQAHPAIETHGAKPDLASLDAFFQDVPKADMVAPVGTFADRALEGQVLLSAVQVQAADVSIGVGAVEHDAEANVDAGPQRDGVGGLPAGK